MKKGIVLGSMAALTLSANVFAADELSYTWVEANYLETELDDDDGDLDGDGLGLSGSFAFTENLHGFASYSDQEFDLDIAPDVSFEMLDIGAGVNFPLNPGLDIIGTLSYLDVQASAGGASADDNGYRLGAALRGRVASKLELTGGISYIDLDDSGDDTTYGVGGRYYFTDNFALGANADFADDQMTWTLGARYDFNK